MARKIQTKEMLQAVVLALSVMMFTPMVTAFIGGWIPLAFLSTPLPIVGLGVLGILTGGAVAFVTMMLIDKYWR